MNSSVALPLLPATWNWLITRLGLVDGATAVRAMAGEPVAPSSRLVIRITANNPWGRQRTVRVGILEASLEDLLKRVRFGQLNAAAAI
jgi:hypothetical protein